MTVVDERQGKKDPKGSNRLRLKGTRQGQSIPRGGKNFVASLLAQADGRV